MGKNRHHNMNKSNEGADIVAEGNEHSTEDNEMNTTIDEQLEKQQQFEEGEQQQAQPEEQNTEQEVAIPVVQRTLGIGEFVRYLLLKSTKTNTEILTLTLQRFEGAQTTMACIAWYKSDLRKKGLLPAGTTRGRQQVVNFTTEELENMTK